MCSHAGNMGQKQGVGNVLEAAQLLCGDGVRIVLAGDGNDRQRLLEKACRLEIDNVSLLPLQASGQYEAMLRAADVLILNQRASVGEMSLPSKLASYPEVARRMVAGVDLIFHLAAVLEGGVCGFAPGRVRPEPTLDGVVVKAAVEARIEKFVFASSGCV